MDLKKPINLYLFLQIVIYANKIFKTSVEMVERFYTTFTLQKFASKNPQNKNRNITASIAVIIVC